MSTGAYAGYVNWLRSKAVLLWLLNAMVSDHMTKLVAGGLKFYILPIMMTTDMKACGYPDNNMYCSAWCLFTVYNNLLVYWQHSHLEFCLRVFIVFFSI